MIVGKKSVAGKLATLESPTITISLLNLGKRATDNASL